MVGGERPPAQDDTSVVTEEGPLAWHDSDTTQLWRPNSTIIAAEARADENLPALRAAVDYETKDYATLFLGQLPAYVKPRRFSRPKAASVSWSLPETMPRADITPQYDFVLHYDPAEGENKATSARMAIRSEHDRYFSHGYESAKQAPQLGISFDDGHITELSMAWVSTNSKALDLLARKPITKALRGEVGALTEDATGKAKHNKSVAQALSTIALHFPQDGVPSLQLNSYALLSYYHRSMSGGQSHWTNQISQAVRFDFEAAANVFRVNPDSLFRYRKLDSEKVPRKVAAIAAPRPTVSAEEYVALIQEILGLIPAAPVPLTYSAAPTGERRVLQ